jgi:hypothetical protein
MLTYERYRHEEKFFHPQNDGFQFYFLQNQDLLTFLVVRVKYFQ